MKLKKIASLMLAGVMAVSMLAGCSNGANHGDANGDGDVVTEISAIVKEFNDGQSAANKAKVEFSSDAALDAAMKKVADAVSVSADEDNIKSYVIAATGIGSISGVSFYDANDQEKLKDGTTVTQLYVKKYDNSNGVWSEAAAMKEAASDANDEIANLADTTYQKGITKDKYFDYSYSGTVSMVTVKEVNGVVNYYIAYTITQTATEETIAAK